MRETVKEARTTLSADDRARLLELAREAVTAAAAGGSPGPLDAAQLSAALRAPAGAFVTLYAAGGLRGCVGTFDTSRPLYEVVRAMGAAAATRDTRFSPVQPAEVAGLTVSISVLTPPQAIVSLEDIDATRHGLLVSRGVRRGVLLNKVARERAWSREAFLSATCSKAGLAPSAWQSFGAPDGIDVAVFEEVDFGEAALPGGG